jgi:hypothetical protein
MISISSRCYPLRCLRPLRSGTLADELREYQQIRIVLNRMERFFPDNFQQNKQGFAWTETEPRLIWEDLLLELYRWADGLLFEVAWPLLEIGEVDLAVFLEHLPLVLYGFGEETWENPLLTLLRYLLSGECVTEEDFNWLLNELGLNSLLGLDTWRKYSFDDSWQRLFLIDKYPERFSQMMRHLPDLARYVCSETGNPLLDQSYCDDVCYVYMIDDWFAWTWDEVEQVRRWWQQARQILEAGEQLTAWARQGENLARLARFIMTGEGAFSITVQEGDCDVSR